MTSNEKRGEMTNDTTPISDVPQEARDELRDVFERRKQLVKDAKSEGNQEAASALRRYAHLGFPALAEITGYTREHLYQIERDNPEGGESS
jgi:hypothetical protein